MNSIGEVGTWKCFPLGYLAGVMMNCLHFRHFWQCLATSFFIPLQWYTHFRAAYVHWKPLWPEWLCASVKTGPTNDEGNLTVSWCSTLACRTLSFNWYMSDWGYFWFASSQFCIFLMILAHLASAAWSCWSTSTFSGSSVWINASVCKSGSCWKASFFSTGSWLTNLVLIKVSKCRGSAGSPKSSNFFWGVLTTLWLRYVDYSCFCCRWGLGGSSCLKQFEQRVTKFLFRRFWC